MRIPRNFIRFFILKEFINKYFIFYALLLNITLLFPNIKVYGNMEYGINDGGICNYSEDEINKRLELMQNAGMNWVRIIFAWKTIEPSSETYDFRELDSTIIKFPGYGIKVLGILCYDNDNIIPSDHACPNNWDGTDYNNWENFVKAVVERYDGDEDWGLGGPPDPAIRDVLLSVIESSPIIHWEVGNEPNLGQFWHGGDEEGITTYNNAKGYIKLLKNTYNNAKDCYINNIDYNSSLTRDDCKIVSGGINGVPGLCGDIFKWFYFGCLGEYLKLGPLGFVDPDDHIPSWLDWFFWLGGCDYFDIFGLHPYQGGGIVDGKIQYKPPYYEETLGDLTIILMKWRLQTIENEYLKGKPIWITEISWGSENTRIVDGVEYNQWHTAGGRDWQAGDLIYLYNDIGKKLDFVENIFWYNLVENDDEPQAVSQGLIQGNRGRGADS